MTRHATDRQFARAMRLAQEHGIEVAGFELTSDGGIKIMSPRLGAVDVAGEESLYDRLKREGKL